MRKDSERSRYVILTSGDYVIDYQANSYLVFLFKLENDFEKSLKSVRLTHLYK